MRTSRTFTVAIVLLAFGLLVTGCGGGEETQTTQDVSQQEPSATGSLVATVNFEGEAPEPKAHDASGNSECGVDEVLSEPVVVNDNGTLKNAVVAVKSAPTSLDKSIEAPTIDQENCEYKPHVAVAKVGQTVEIHDSDPNMHNVRGSLDGRQLFNETTFKGNSAKVSLGENGAVSLQCDVHPWMQAWVYVSENGAAAVTGDEGTVSLSDLPTGDYTLEIWHEKYGTQEATVTVNEDEEASVSVTYNA